MSPSTPPDLRYFVVRGRLWRATHPALPDEARGALVQQLMNARRAVKTALDAHDAARLAQARAEVNAAKIAPGERGPVWWTDGAKDFNRHLVKIRRMPTGIKGLRGRRHEGQIPSID
ncbi:hypothetical protein [Polaromonas sp. CG_9.11]|uniref:hypothetical protein n=1 Tax=Polaromonas sp. CG_9.11 TaxID=2787730 RepID=UPI001A2FF28E|nr:hypothetical protein [Polaromonas sp. CG_9.11]MBG6076340.1 hypothetical protein [Polaromonas sp. CG_9.11]